MSLGIGLAEIDHLIELLRELKADPQQHFHIGSDYKAPGGLGDIEVYVKQADELDNLFFSSLAFAPGDDVGAAL